MRKITVPYLWAAFLMHNPSISKVIPDRTYLKIVYRGYMGKRLDLDNPTTFNEKLQLLKLMDHNPVYSRMVDKYEAKKYVADIIGEEYIIKTFGVWDHFDEIDFDRLPDQFVLKCTHDSGGLIICRDKNAFNKAAAKKKIEKSLKTEYYYMGREWPYKNVKPRIIAEQFMEDHETHELRDYKFFCFDGVPKALFIATDRSSGGETRFDFFDMEFRHLPIQNGHPNAVTAPSKPETFEKMKDLAARLSQNIPQLRVDFYEVNGKVYFGELTFSHWSGLVPFEPEEWDRTFGDWIQLPERDGAASAGL